METGIYLAPFTAMHLSGTQETLHSVLHPESKIPHLQRKGTPCLQPQPHAQVHKETSEGDSTAYADPTLSSRVSLPTIPPHCLAPQGHIPKKEALACPLQKPVSQEWLLSIGSLVFLFLHSELSWLNAYQHQVQICPHPPVLNIVQINRLRPLEPACLHTGKTSAQHLLK